jgi:AraC family transcriptional regulator of adaptative response / DNA-3-methyladenine glycosylase II
MRIDGDTCYRALTARDARFDGLFFVGVATTGIYCRPVCTARTPGRERCTFYGTAAEAERAGFRACFRCRPELAPGHAPVDAAPRLVDRAVRLVDAGFLDGRRVDDLAAALGVGARHLRRAFDDALGLSPVELAQSRRIALARHLLRDTALPLADVAFASGFSSVRRFNAAFAERVGRPPSALRRQGGDADALTLRLDYRPPLDWPALLAFLRVRALPGVETVGDDAYRRVVAIGDHVGTVEVRPDPRRAALRARVSPSLAGVLTPLVARLRALFDLDARPDLVASVLGADPLLAEHVARRPGLRVPGAVDPFETTVRAVLGQQVSVRAATTLAGRFVERFGVETEHGRRFPRPAEVGDTDGLGLPRARAATLAAVARLFAVGDVDPHRLRDVPGIGDWTAEYVAMRAFGRPDAFPAGDLVVRRALGDLSIVTAGAGGRGACTAAQARARAEAWRPWRAYATLHLWTP